MTILTHTPALIAPNRAAAVTFSLTESGSSYVRVWCTVAPTGSRLYGEINSSTDPRNRVVVFEGARGSNIWNTSFDRGGKYTFVAQEYEKGAGYGGGYTGDPNGSDREELVGAETTLTVYVGQRVTQVIGPPQHQATLVLWVWDNLICKTSKAFHGEDSPAIVASAPSPLVKTAIESATVASALANLVDKTPSVAIGDLQALVENYYDKFFSHQENGSIHIDPDEANYILVAWRSAWTPKELKDFINRAIFMLRNHILNDGSLDPVIAATATGPNSAEYHLVSDRENIPLFDTVGSFAEAYSAFADLNRCYSAHRINTDAHSGVPASYNTVLTALPPLLAVHKAYHSVIASASPPPPPAQTQGVQTLVSGAGFSEG